MSLQYEVNNAFQDLGVLLWSNGTSRSMVVSKGGHEEVRRFWKRNKQN